MSTPYKSTIWTASMKFGLGSVCCQDEEEIEWSIERKYCKLTKYLFEHRDEASISMLDFDFIDASKLDFVFAEATKKEYNDVLEKLLNHPDTEFVKVGKIDERDTYVWKTDDFSMFTHMY